MEHKTNFQHVQEFTNAVRLGRGLGPCPDKPSPMTREEVIFIAKMVMSEMAELVDTISESSEDTMRIMRECLGADPSKHVKYETEAELISAQADGLIDAKYYIDDMGSKKGINLDDVFNLVHQANMNKLVDGKAIIRPEDGKVLKPEGWKEADIVEFFKTALNT